LSIGNFRDIAKHPASPKASGVLVAAFLALPSVGVAGLAVLVGLWALVPKRRPDDVLASREPDLTATDHRGHVERTLDRLRVIRHGITDRPKHEDVDGGRRRLVAKSDPER
jgi:hypothetical protein